MDEITWTVTLTWCYDGKHIAKTAKEIVKMLKSIGMH